LKEQLLNIDTQIFIFLNSLHHKGLDPVMVFITSRYFWLFVYIPVLILMIIKSGKKTFFIFPLIALTHIITDKISVLIKNWVMRPRPCRVEEIQEHLHLLVGCSQYGYVSSHAANSFALITVLIILKKWWADIDSKYLIPTLTFWAFITSYSRIYVGVHYPLDIISGAIFGFFCAFILCIVFQKFIKRVF
jgi:undecaprenyl-diphosphatase